MGAICHFDCLAHGNTRGNDVGKSFSAMVWIIDICVHQILFAKHS